MDFTNLTIKELTELNGNNPYKAHQLHIQRQNLIHEIELKIAEVQSVIYQAQQKRLNNIKLTEQEKQLIQLGADAVIKKGLL